MSSLKKWDYYVEEILATGPSYDWNMGAAKCSALEEADQTDGSVSQKKRKIVWPCYDDVKKIQPDAISSLLNVSTYVKQKKISYFSYHVSSLPFIYVISQFLFLVIALYVIALWILYKIIIKASQSSYLV